MLMPPFEPSAIAFLDILGFKEFVKQAERQPAYLSQLQSLRNVIENQTVFEQKYLKATLPKQIVPKYIFISDSIFISVPLAYQGYDGAVIVALKIVQLAHALFEMGFMLRGGLDVGSVWHDDDNVFGSGVADAYAAEQSAVYPRVVLTDAAIQHWGSAQHQNIMAQSTNLCIKYEKRWMVHTLNSNYVKGAPNYRTLEDAFQQYKAHIYSKRSCLTPGSSAHAKWDWMARYFNDSLVTQEINLSPV